MSATRFHVWESKYGWIAAAASDKGITQMSSPEADRDEAEDLIFPAQLECDNDPEYFDGIGTAIDAYLDGDSDALDDLPTDFSDAPPLTAAMWDACRTIPWGETRSYAWLAAEAGRPGAPRAAGRAMAINRVAMLVPCHRVIRSDGSLGGFGGPEGLEVKRKLLAAEQD
jgi:O-6-methylguanine DNA methyltransferase